MIAPPCSALLRPALLRAALALALAGAAPATAQTGTPGSTAQTAADPAAAQTASIETWTMHGTIGHYPVVLSISLADGRQVVRGHYFYTRHLADIPLGGRMEGGRLTLTEPDGGRFDLRLTATGQNPHGFADATGLAGNWHRAATVLPVTLSFDGASPGLPPARRYADVTSEPDAAFEARVRRFLRGVTENDRAMASAAISFPLRINGPRGRTIRDRKALFAQWDHLFTPAYIATLRTAVPHDMFVRNGLAMVAGGAVWFDARGAVALNLP